MMHVNHTREELAVVNARTWCGRCMRLWGHVRMGPMANAGVGRQGHGQLKSAQKGQQQTFQCSRPVPVRLGSESQTPVGSMRLVPKHLHEGLVCLES
jgi:hypothetical protein